MRSGLLYLSLALGCLGLGISRAHAAQPGCMKCHGDEAVMKALVKPVIHASSEGEG
ncbi:MAG: hypothetical protein HY900_18800 [Deltaproteobacteria bacterium]|nr:hypothetical protein [Deltaproteobacteria bacterium]